VHQTFNTTIHPPLHIHTSIHTSIHQLIHSFIHSFNQTHIPHSPASRAQGYELKPAPEVTNP
jgi:hypothetical protein